MLFALSALAFADPLYVQATQLALRENPSPDAAIVGWLHAGTAVEVLDERGDRLLVSVGGRPTDHPVEGWVAGSFLGTERRAPLARPAEEGGAVWVAACDGRRAELVATVDAHGHVDDAHQWQGSAHQLIDLSAVSWLAMGDGGLSVVPGSPFVAPFATDSWNEEGASAWVPGTCQGICDVLKIVLGPCEVVGTLFVSRPVSPLSRSAFRVDDWVYDVTPFTHENTGGWTIASGDVTIEVGTWGYGC